jgi:hypothetical protein
VLYGRNDEDGRESKASRPQPGLSLSARRWLVLILGVALVGGAALVWLPEVARWVTLAQIQALTWRPVSIEAVELNLLTADSRFAGSVSPSM